MIWLLYIVFLIPAIIAWVRDHSSRTAITILSILNAFLAIDFSSAIGLFLVLILLLWAIIGRSKEKPEVKVVVEEKKPEATPSEPIQTDSVKQLIKLAEMKDKGLLSEEEYEAAKQKVLNS